jgi:hypothetical protein
MSLACRRSPLRSMTKIVIAVSVLLAFRPDLALAYGSPPSPPGPPGPGGINCVVTSRLAPSYENVTIGPIRIGELLVTLRIPAYTFRSPVQVTITEPFSSGAACQGGPTGNFGFRGYHVLGGIGILIGLGYTGYGTFPHPVRLRIDEVRLHDLRSLELASVTVGRATAVSSRRTRGPFVLSIRRSAEFVVLDRLKPPSRHRPARHHRRGPSDAQNAARLDAMLRPGMPAAGLGVLRLPVLHAGGAAALAR